MTEETQLRALDGSNPLAFLAALGALRVLTLRLGRGVRMRWVSDGKWCPELIGVLGPDRQVSETIKGAISVPVEQFAELGKDITVSPQVFKHFVRRQERGTTPSGQNAAAFAAAFGSEVCSHPRNDDRIQYTDLCFMTGSGHQHFLATMGTLKGCVTTDHIHDALFGEWRRERGNSMRWDPSDAAEYALQWGDPSLEGASSVWGANLLAVEALPLFGAFPVKPGQLRTTGFRVIKRGEDPQFSWPIWTEWAGLDVVRSLLSLEQLGDLGNSTNPESDARIRANLRQIGIDEVYRAARVRIGKGANFKVSFRPSSAV